MRPQDGVCARLVFQLVLQFPRKIPLYSLYSSLGSESPLMPKIKLHIMQKWQGYSNNAQFDFFAYFSNLGL